MAGGLLTDADDVEGAPIAAVMSYATWQRDYAGDPSVVGSTFWVNTKPVTIAGIAPAGILWRQNEQRTSGFLPAD